MPQIERGLVTRKKPAVVSTSGLLVFLAVWFPRKSGGTSRTYIQSVHAVFLGLLSTMTMTG